MFKEFFLEWTKTSGFIRVHESIRDNLISYSLDYKEGGNLYFNFFFDKDKVLVFERLYEPKFKVITSLEEFSRILDNGLKTLKDTLELEEKKLEYKKIINSLYEDDWNPGLYSVRELEQGLMFHVRIGDNGLYLTEEELREFDSFLKRIENNDRLEFNEYYEYD